MAVPARLIGLAFALVAAVSFGANPPFAKLAAGDGVPPINAAFLRAAFLLAAVGGLAWLARLPLSVPVAARRPLSWLCLGALLVNLCYLASVAFIPVALAAVIFYTFPLVILVVTPFLDSERLTPGRIGAFLLAFAGLAVAIAPSASTIDWRGIALALGASSGEVILFFAAARTARHINSLTMAFWAHLLIVPGALAVVLLFGQVSAIPATGIGLAVLAVICVTYCAGFGFQLAAAAFAPPVVLSVVFYIEPVVSTGLAALLLAETLAPHQYAGSAIVLAALAMAAAIELRAMRRPPVAVAAAAAIAVEPPRSTGERR